LIGRSQHRNPAGKYDNAVRYAEQALSQHPNAHQSLRAAITSYTLPGRIEQAQKCLARLSEIDPGLRVSTLKEITPLQQPDHLKIYENAMRLAGLQE